MRALPASMYVHHLHTSGAQRGQKREFGPGSGVMGDCEPPTYAREISVPNHSAISPHPKVSFVNLLGSRTTHELHDCGFVLCFV